MRKHSLSTNKIAEICGVSQGTVDRALNNRVGINPKTKERILRVAKQYGYRPNIHARTIAGGKSMLIGVIIFDLNNRYFTEFITRFEKQCSALGYSIVTMFTDKDPVREIECIKTLYNMSVDGIVICPIGEGAEYESFLLSLDTPIITIGNKLTQIKYVGIDNETAMQAVTQHVIDSGYTDLIYVMPDKPVHLNFSAQDDRLAGFLKAASKNSVTYRISNITDARCDVLKNITSAFICSTDIYAIQLALITKKHDVYIIGFDDVDLINELELGFDSLSSDTDAITRGALEYITNGTLPKNISYSLTKRYSI